MTDFVRVRFVNTLFAYTLLTHRSRTLHALSRVPRCQVRVLAILYAYLAAVRVHLAATAVRVQRTPPRAAMRGSMHVREAARPSAGCRATVLYVFKRQYLCSWEVCDFGRTTMSIDSVCMLACTR